MFLGKRDVLSYEATFVLLLWSPVSICHHRTDTHPPSTFMVIFLLHSLLVARFPLLFFHCNCYCSYFYFNGKHCSFEKRYIYIYFFLLPKKQTHKSPPPKKKKKKVQTKPTPLGRITIHLSGVIILNSVK